MDDARITRTMHGLIKSGGETERLTHAAWNQLAMREELLPPP